MRPLIVLAVALTLSVLPVAPAHADSCEVVGWVGSCGTSNSGSQVDVTGTQTTPGDSGSSGASHGSGGSAAPPPEEECDNELCRGNYEVIGIPEITLADLASFVPARPRLTGEPAGLGVVGMPANIIATASEQRIPGTLFDFDVVVRFVPTEYVFDYGDGAHRTTPTGGTAWQSLGQADFTPTATSHVYRSRGTYSTSVTVRYRASVDFGAGWLAVPGVVESTTRGYDVRVVEVHTALVDKTCAENPQGPGC